MTGSGCRCRSPRIMFSSSGRALTGPGPTALLGCWGYSPGQSLLPSCATWGELRGLSEPLLSHLWDGHKNTTCLRGLNETMQGRGWELQEASIHGSYDGYNCWINLIRHLLCVWDWAECRDGQAVHHATPGVPFRGAGVAVEETLTVSLQLMEFCLKTTMVAGLCHGGDGNPWEFGGTYSWTDEMSSLTALLLPDWSEERSVRVRVET